MTPELRDFARRVVAKATELDEVGVLDDWLQVFVELAKDDDAEDAAQEQAGEEPKFRCPDCDFACYEHAASHAGHLACGRSSTVHFAEHCRTTPTPPVARAEQPALDPAIVEECEGEAWQAGVCNRQALNAALTHYESRVVGPLRYERSLYKLEADKLRAELAAIKARPAPATDEERKRYAKAVREGHYIWDDRERIATLLEEPEREGES